MDECLNNDDDEEHHRVFFASSGAQHEDSQFTQGTYSKKQIMRSTQNLPAGPLGSNHP
jgi:hypothetical protein